MIYSRKIYPQLLEHAQGPQVTVLTGMRRTGKTTLVKQLLEDLKNKNSIYLDFQKVDLRDIFNEKNYDLIRNKLISFGLKSENMVVAIDEVQLMPDAPSAIKYLYDHFGIKFIITGSSSYYLKNLFSESLAGRKRIFELYPLDFGEFLIFKGVNFKFVDWKKETFNKVTYSLYSSYYEEYIRFGGFPQVVLENSNDEKTNILKDIFSSYVNIDIKTLADFADEKNLLNLAKMLSSRIGSKVEVSKLSSLTGLSRPTINNYLSFFEKTYLVSTIPVYTRNPDREVVKARKLYFCDTGIASLFSNISDGSQFENSLFNQLSRQGGVSYYSLKNGNEIDFILDEKVAFEAKETPTKQDYDYLSRMANLAKIKNFKLIGRNVSPKFKDYIWGGSIL